MNVTDAYGNSSTNTINIKNSNSSHMIIYSCGYNAYGKLGIGNTTDQYTPEIGRAHVRTPVTSLSRMPSSA